MAREACILCDKKVFESDFWWLPRRVAPSGGRVQQNGEISRVFWWNISCAFPGVEKVIEKSETAPGPSVLDRPLKDILKGAQPPDGAGDPNDPAGDELIDARVVIRIIEFMLVLKDQWPSRFAFTDPSDHSIESTFLKWRSRRGPIDRKPAGPTSMLLWPMYGVISALTIAYPIAKSLDSFFNAGRPIFDASNQTATAMRDRLHAARLYRVEKEIRIQNEKPQTDTEPKTDRPDSELALRYFWKRAKALEIKLTAKHGKTEIETDKHVLAHLFFQVARPSLPCNHGDTPAFLIKISRRDALRIVGTLVRNDPGKLLQRIGILRKRLPRLFRLRSDLFMRDFSYRFLIPAIWQPILDGVGWSDLDPYVPFRNQRYTPSSLGYALRTHEQRAHAADKVKKPLRDYPEALYATLLDMPADGKHIRLQQACFEVLDMDANLAPHERDAEKDKLRKAFIRAGLNGPSEMFQALVEDLLD